MKKISTVYERISQTPNESFIKVSVIIPVYNVEKYIGECLDSLINQELEDIEFICINDGSTDNSLNILNQYAQKDKRFRIITQKNNGQGLARNRGIEQAKGKYIAFVDPDDIVKKTWLKELYAFAERENSTIVQYNYNEFGRNTEEKIIDFKKIYKKNFGINIDKTNCFNIHKIKKENLFISINYHCWARLYNTDFIKKNAIKFAPTRNGEDHLFVISAILNTNKVDFYDKTLYYYRIRPDSSMNKKTDSYQDVFVNIWMLEEYLTQTNFIKKYKKKFDRYKIQILLWQYTQIQESSINDYIIEVEKVLNKKEYSKFRIELNKPRCTFFENLLSIKNEKIDGIKQKYLTFLGVKIYLNRGNNG